MKTTVLKASLKIANDCADTLLQYKTKKGSNMFTKHDTTNGFEIKGKSKNDSGQWVDIVVLRWTDDNGRKKIDYDERLLTF